MAGSVSRRSIVSLERLTQLRDNYASAYLGGRELNGTLLRNAQGYYSEEFTERLENAQSGDSDSAIRDPGTCIPLDSLHGFLTKELADVDRAASSLNRSFLPSPALRHKGDANWPRRVWRCVAG